MIWLEKPKAWRWNAKLRPVLLDKTVGKCRDLGVLSLASRPLFWLPPNPESFSHPGSFHQTQQSCVFSLNGRDLLMYESCLNPFPTDACLLEGLLEPRNWPLCQKGVLRNEVAYWPKALPMKRGWWQPSTGLGVSSCSQFWLRSLSSSVSSSSAIIRVGLFPPEDVAAALTRATIYWLPTAHQAPSNPPTVITVLTFPTWHTRAWSHVQSPGIWGCSQKQPTRNMTSFKTPFINL